MRPSPKRQVNVFFQYMFSYAIYVANKRQNNVCKYMVTFCYFKITGNKN